MLKFFYIIVILKLTLLPLLNCQTETISHSVSTGLYLGFPFSTSPYSSITVISIFPIDRTMKPVFSAGMDLRIPLVSFLGCSISGMSEVGYSKIVPRKKINVFFGPDEPATIDGYIQRIPVLVGVNIKSVTELSPFIQGSIGTAFTRYNHTVSVDNGYSFDISAWQFCWAIGAGFNYSITPDAEIEIFTKGWFTESNLTKQFLYEEIGIIGRFAIITFGVNTIFHI